jgi:hypothetical protein
MSYFSHKYFNTYYYANIISNILSQDIELIGFISNFFSDAEMIYELAIPFQKDSAFHCLIKYMIGEFFENDMDDYDQIVFKSGDLHRNPAGLLYVERALMEYGLDDYLFKDFVIDKPLTNYSVVEAYRDDLILTGRLEELYDKIANEVFYIMFNNREALLQFNFIVASHMDVDIGEVDDIQKRRLFNRQGHLKRVRIPDWCKKAVFFRDRGKCCLCQKDLSGTLRIDSGKQFDHIVPLAKGGLNDVSNIQLLCSACNNKKNKHEIITSQAYESWY